MSAAQFHQCPHCRYPLRPQMGERTACKRKACREQRKAVAAFNEQNRDAGRRALAAYTLPSQDSSGER